MKTNLFKNHVDSVFMVFDTIACYPIGFITAHSYGEACRKAMISLHVPLRDSSIYKIGTFTPDDSPNFTPCKLEFVPWDKYKLPESISEALAPLNASPDELREIVESVAKKSEE